MMVVDRLGKEIKVGDKIAWVSTSYGSAYLKIGNVVEIESKFIVEHDDNHYDYVTRSWVETGKKYRSYEVIIKADILHPSDLNHRYIAKMPEIGCEHEDEEFIVKVNRAEKI